MPSSQTRVAGQKGLNPAIVILAGCAIAAIGFGARSSLGLYLGPMMATSEGGEWSFEVFGLALALQNLFWGLALPIAGGLADKYGSTRVIIFGALLYAIGLYGMSAVESASMLYLFAGVISGIGIAFSAFSLAMAAMVRVVSPEKRTLVLGVGTAAGSFGQVLFSPISQRLIESLGWESALGWLAMIVLCLIPLAMLLPAVGKGTSVEQSNQTLRSAVHEAFAHRGFVLLTLGFFVCGFHVAFITVHFPSYVQSLGLDLKVGAYCLALIGLFNIVGSFLSGYIGQHHSNKLGLATIYLLRSIVIFWMLMSPKTPAILYGFASMMGLLWLSTVPLTTGIIAQVFGVRYMATLFGIVFLSHQIGSFIGVWLGGVLYERTGSYDGMWWAGIVVGLAAAIIHLPINEKPLPRLTREAVS